MRGARIKFGRLYPAKRKGLLGDSTNDHKLHNSRNQTRRLLSTNGSQPVVCCAPLLDPILPDGSPMLIKDAICEAIEKKKLIQFQYERHTRVVEPHLLGRDSADRSEE